MDQLRINVADDDLWRETLQALGTATATVDYRCSKCRTILANAGMTSRGPLFTSTWMVPRLSPIVVNDKRVNARELDKVFAAIRDSGPPTTSEEPHGVIALLRVPGGLTVEYPDLLVRCKDHGDAVLSRQYVLGHIERPPLTAVPVEVSNSGRHSYMPPRRDFDLNAPYATQTRSVADRAIRSRGGAQY